MDIKLINHSFLFSFRNNLSISEWCDYKIWARVPRFFDNSIVSVLDIFFGY